MSHDSTSLLGTAKRFLLSLILLGSALASQAQTYEIDLARSLDETQTVEHNVPLRIRLTHMLPFKEGYTVNVQRRIIPMPPFTTPTAPRDSPQKAGIADPCQELKDATAAVLAVTEEAELPVALAALQGQIETAPPVSESNPKGCTYELLKARVVLDATVYGLGSYELNRGEILEVTISRKQKDGKLKTWKYTYTTQPRGEWQVSYGFSFITQGFDKEAIFFAAPQDSAYVIKEESNRRKLNFAPSIFFTWVPQKSLNRNWSWSLSGGLGFDFESPTVFLGPTVSFNQNVKFNFGVVAHKQRVLLGKYEENQRISEPLTEDQLHDDLYRLNPFFSLSLRFTQNPFERNGQ